MYDVDSGELVMPQRGRVPITEESVERILGIPRGDEEVVYQVDSDTEERMTMSLFGGQSNMPKTTEVGEMLDGIKDAGERFKALWLMYAMCTLLAPTTLNRVSNRSFNVLVSAVLLFLPPYTPNIMVSIQCMMW